MPGGFLVLLCSAVALAQLGPAPRDPFDTVLESYQEARVAGSFDQAAAHREQARALAAHTPPDSPRFAGHVQTVSQLYQGAGRHAQAQAILEDALARTAVLGPSHPIRLQLLEALAGFWQQDGNLLRAAAEREKIVAAMEAAPPQAGETPLDTNPPHWFGTAAFITGTITVHPMGAGRMLYGAPNIGRYQQLADLYRQLGRPEEATQMMAKARKLVQDNPGALAAFYEREGDLDQALAQYKRQAAQAAANPDAQVWELTGPWQSMANVYQRQERWQDAAAALEQAVNQLESSGKPEAPSQAISLRLQYARMLQRSGDIKAADQVYQALQAGTADEPGGMGFQVRQDYANYLADTNRGTQGTELLKDYMANHADLEPWQQSSLLWALSHTAERAGQKELAAEYQRQVEEQQRAMQAKQQPPGPLIGPDLQKAQAAANQGNLEEALNLGLHALASAAPARDRDQVPWQVTNLASVLAAKKAPEKAERLYHDLLPLVESWAVDDNGPLLQVRQQYARFVMAQRDRWGEAPAAIGRYQQAVVDANGPESSAMKQVIHLRLEFARARGAQAEAVRSAEDLLALEESLSGNTSQPYMHAARTAAGAFESAGNRERALAMHRQIVKIADLTLRADDLQRADVRMAAASVFASARQFDEAERLAGEAVTIAAGAKPPPPRVFAGQLEQIRRMKAAAESR